MAEIFWLETEGTLAGLVCFSALSGDRSVRPRIRAGFITYTSPIETSIRVNN